MTGPLLNVVAVFCPKCRRAQIHRVEDAPSPPQPCWYCRNGIKVDGAPSRMVPVDSAATIPTGGAT
jgi:hypothetical protein